MDHRAYREALGCFATGITVVTGVSREGELLGFTANSFNSVSLDPPLVLFNLDRKAYSLKPFVESGRFAVNVLREGHEALSVTFARTDKDKWNGVPYTTWDTGCPILEDTLAAFECRTRATYDGGDHVIFVGEVMRMWSDPCGQPLLFFRGRYCGINGET